MKAYQNAEYGCQLSLKANKSKKQRVSKLFLSLSFFQFSLGTLNLKIDGDILYTDDVIEDHDQAFKPNEPRQVSQFCTFSTLQLADF